MEQGVDIIPSVFAAADLRAAEAALMTAARSRAGIRHLLQVPAIRTLADDPRLIRIAVSFIGRSAAPFKATLFDKSRHSNWLVTWHQDIALPLRSRVDVEDWGPWSRKGGQLYALAPAEALSKVVALRVHLDDSTLANGPLRVLPDTHRMGRLSDERIRQLAQTVTPVDCTITAGGVIAMRPLIVHASSKSRGPLPRRVLHIEYAAEMALGDGVELALP